MIYNFKFKFIFNSGMLFDEVLCSEGCNRIVVFNCIYCLEFIIDCYVIKVGLS